LILPTLAFGLLPHELFVVVATVLFLPFVSSDEIAEIPYLERSSFATALKIITMVYYMISRHIRRYE